MDPSWLDRELVDQKLKGVDDSEVTYDQELGVYCYRGKPFTGVCIQRFPDERLNSVVHFVRGLAHGISAAWYPNGQIELYNEMAADVYHGLHLKWSEDGTKQVEERYHEGRLIPRSGQK